MTTLPEQSRQPRTALDRVIMEAAGKPVITSAAAVDPVAAQAALDRLTVIQAADRQVAIDARWKEAVGAARGKATIKRDGVMAGWAEAAAIVNAENGRRAKAS